TVSESFFHSSSPFFLSNCRAPDWANCLVGVTGGGADGEPMRSGDRFQVQHGTTNRFTLNKNGVDPYGPPADFGRPWRGKESPHPVQHPAGRTKPLKDRTSETFPHT